MNHRYDETNQNSKNKTQRSSSNRWSKGKLWNSLQEVVESEVFIFFLFYKTKRKQPQNSPVMEAQEQTWPRDCI